MSSLDVDKKSNDCLIQNYTNIYIVSFILINPADNVIN